MKRQVARLSPHQNGKVIAVLAAVSSLIFLIPFGMLYMAFAPAATRPPLLTMIVLPIIYLVMGYVTAGLGCLIYNALYRWIGGIEYESSQSEG